MRKMSKLEKSLFFTILGGIILNKVIPDKYIIANIIPLTVSAFACAGMGIKTLCNLSYNMSLGPYQNNKNFKN